MPTPLNAFAKCILDWIYQQVHEILEMLKAFLLGLIAQIDALIAILRAWLAQWDLLAKLEEAAWKLVQKVIDEIRDALMTVPEGPLTDLCPEWYKTFMDPAIAIFENAVATLTILREKFHNDLSYMDEIDSMIAYWDQIKVDMIAMVEILDDAILIALSEAGEAVP